MVINWRDEFICFLKENGLYDDFFAYFCGVDLRIIDPCLYIVSSFDWELTDEGNEFWGKVNEDWHNYIKVREGKWI